jgi:hypothetical protein
MVKELVESTGEVETVYKVTVGKDFNKRTLEVFPHTIKRLLDLNVYLLRPEELAEAIREEFRRAGRNVDGVTRVIYEFNITEDAEKYKVDITVFVGNNVFSSVGTHIPIPDEDVKTQLKYALKIMEQDKMIDDLFELLNLYRLDERKEDDE